LLPFVAICSFHDANPSKRFDQYEYLNGATGDRTIRPIDLDKILSFGTPVTMVTSK
jgi:hypothetical protein